MIHGGGGEANIWYTYVKMTHFNRGNTLYLMRILYPPLNDFSNGTMVFCHVTV